MKYRLIGTAGVFDLISTNKERLIALASRRTGHYTLWEWNGRQWIKAEQFIF